GSVVGRKLWNLTAGNKGDEGDNGDKGRLEEIRGNDAHHSPFAVRHSHQVICITHLPQIAAYGDAHYRVDKIVADERTTTAVYSLQGEERVSELAQMLGTVGEAGEQSAVEILQAAEKEKSSQLVSWSDGQLVG